MIVVHVKRSEHGIEEITLSGHAQAAEYGQDIVCSAVSGISFGILNAVHPLVGIVPDVERAERGGGFLRWSVRALEEKALHEKLQLLAETMVISLYAVSQQYGEYVTVRDTKWQGGAQPC